MRSRVIKVLCASLFFTLAGCIPFLTFVDFTPQMAGGAIRTSNCADKESVEYVIDGIKITSNLSMWSRTGDSAPFLHVFFDIPAGVNVELQSRDISVTSVLVTGTKRFPIPAFRDPRYLVSPGRPPRPSNGGELNFQQLSATTSFGIHLPMPEMPVGDLRVELPDMRIKDRLVKIPPIEFKKFRRVVVMAPLNC